MECWQASNSENDRVGDGVQTCPRVNFDNGTDFNNSLDDECNDHNIDTTYASNRVDLVHSKLQKEQIPVIGMKFETEEDAYTFYNSYAYNFGFSIRKSKAHFSSKRRLINRLYVCSADGKRGVDKRDVNVKVHRAETRFDCLARMKISCTTTNKYCIVEFSAHHTRHYNS